ncbi:hypothetical protein P5704_027890 (plasmid) [Pseudomonas sp. FeN3W]|nr:hypothetical protein P5704_027890 [Pseudomonas sp. FeN3W]
MYSIHNKHSALIEAENKLFGSIDPNEQLSLVVQMSDLIDQIRNTGMAGHVALTQNAKRVQKNLMSIVFGEKQSISHEVIEAILGVVPITASFTLAAASCPAYHPVLGAAVESLIAQQAFDSAIDGANYTRIVEKLFFINQNELAYKILDAGLVYNSESDEPLSRELASLAEEGIEEKNEAMLFWLRKNENILAKSVHFKTFREGFMLSHVFEMNDLGLKVLAQEVAKVTSASAYGDELYRRDVEIGIKLTEEEVLSGNLPIEPLLIYSYCAPSLKFPLHALHGYTVSMREINEISAWIPKSASNERYHEINKTLLCNCIIKNKDFEDFIETFIDNEIGLPENYLQDVFDSFHPKCIKSLNEIMHFAGMANKRGVRVDNLAYREEIDDLYKRSSQSYGPDHHLKVLKRKPFHELITPDLLVRMTEFNFLKSNDSLRRKMLMASPPWVVEASPMLRKQRISNEFGL